MMYITIPYEYYSAISSIPEHVTLCYTMIYVSKSVYHTYIYIYTYMYIYIHTHNGYH